MPHDLFLACHIEIFRWCFQLRVLLNVVSVLLHILHEVWVDLEISHFLDVKTTLVALILQVWVHNLVLYRPARILVTFLHFSLLICHSKLSVARIQIN